MATLKNITNDIHIVFTLKIIKETPKWIGYTLKVLTQKESQKVEFLKLDKEDELYLDNFTEPEIPTICKGLESITNNEISNFYFQPIDEKDFNLEIKRENNIYKLNLFMQEAMLLNTYQWDFHPMIGLQMKFEKEDLVCFSNELKKEYQELLSNN